MGEGAGERIERDQRRRRNLAIGVLFASGFAIGIGMGTTHLESIFNDEADWSPWLAIGLSLAWLGAIFGGAISIGRLTDEVERANQYRATAVAAAAYFFSYPVWFLLWKGGLLPEPTHGALFVLFWLTLLVSSLYYRFR